jgi:hypothetical protein
LAASAALGVCLLAGTVAAQEAPVSPARKDNPGLFESIGRFFDQGAANVRDSLEGAKRRMDDLGDEAAANSRNLNNRAAEAGKNAADAVTKLPTARVMTGRERCTVAPNGAPDCIAAAEQLCRKHGYASGSSMDFTSAEECPAKVYLGGANTGPECQTVTFISRAMCQ